MGSFPLNATVSAVTLGAIGWTAKAKAAGMDTSSDLVLLGAYVLYQKFVEGYSGFAGPYFETLPQDCPWAPCMWKQEEVEFARKYLPSLHEELVSDRAVVEAEYHLFRVFFDNDKETWRTDHDITLADFCYGRMMVSSRWFGITDGKQSDDEMKFRTTHGVTHVMMTGKSNYSASHMVPYLDLFNHRIIRDPEDTTYFAEISTWEMSPKPDERFVLKSLKGGETKKGDEAFITYGSRGINEMLMHYGFLVDLGVEYYEPSIRLVNPESDPLHVLKHNAILQCWPMHDSEWVTIMPQNLPVEVFQRALVLQERREEILSNVTHIREHICKSTGTFGIRDIETLRRNKRAMLMVLEAMLALERSMPSHEENVAALAAPNLSYNMRNMLIMRENLRVNLQAALTRFRKGTWRLLKQVHIIHG